MMDHQNMYIETLYDLTWSWLEAYYANLITVIIFIMQTQLQLLLLLVIVAKYTSSVLWHCKVDALCVFVFLIDNDYSRPNFNNF